MINRPTCFVAMRLGEDDTDSIYNRYIEPTIRSMGLSPVRIDNIEHNENIDIRIIDELKKADIVIADLTYARPSVYYEAGYAERKVPVIYTCRRDHLDANNPSRTDSTRVHFDIEHRNIIDWVDIHDSVFATRLERRIRHLMGLITNSTLLELEEYLFDLRTSLSNPENIFRRRENFNEFLGQYPPPIDASSADFEENIRKRRELFVKYFDFLKSQNLEDAILQNMMRELFSNLRTEISYLNNQLTDARYGHAFFLASQVKDLYSLFLRVAQEIYQRPSSDYGNIYNQVQENIEALIAVLRQT